MGLKVKEKTKEQFVLETSTWKDWGLVVIFFLCGMYLFLQVTGLTTGFWELPTMQKIMKATLLVVFWLVSAVSVGEIDCVIFDKHTESIHMIHSHIYTGKVERRIPILDLAQIQIESSPDRTNAYRINLLFKQGYGIPITTAYHFEKAGQNYQEHLAEEIRNFVGIKAKIDVKINPVKSSAEKYADFYENTYGKAEGDQPDESQEEEPHPTAITEPEEEAAKSDSDADSCSDWDSIDDSDNEEELAEWGWVKEECPID